MNTMKNMGMNMYGVKDVGSSPAQPSIDARTCPGKIAVRSTYKALAYSKDYLASLPDQASQPGLVSFKELVRRILIRKGLLLSHLALGRKIFKGDVENEVLGPPTGKGGGGSTGWVKRLFKVRSDEFASSIHAQF